MKYLGAITSDYDLVNKKYVDDSIADLPSFVSGVKGNSESSYRTGNVNLTAANIGAVPTSRNQKVLLYQALVHTTLLWGLLHSIADIRFVDTSTKMVDIQTNGLYLMVHMVLT